MKIYTKNGDKGFSSTYDGRKLKKFSPVFKTLSEIDQLSCFIGLAAVYVQETKFVEIYTFLRRIQADLQDINSKIGNLDEKYIATIRNGIVDELENKIDEMETINDPLTKFIIPCVTLCDSHIHLCRTQTRKVETRISKLYKNDGGIQEELILRYINRLSDYFFVLARFMCKMSGKGELFKENLQ
jgi:cob(I)alamin adenosyltransferase